MLEPGKRVVLFFKPYGPSFLKVIESFQKNPQIQVVECSSATDATSIARRLEECMVVGYIVDPEQISAPIALLKALQKELRLGNVRVVLESRASEPSLLSKLNAYRCSEVISSPITAKGLHFKIGRHLKMLADSGEGSTRAAGKSNGKLDKNDDSQDGRPKGQDVTTGARKPSGSASLLVDPLTILSDCWLIHDAGGARQIGGRWVVRLRGPNSQLGRWTKMEVPESPGASSTSNWQWNPNNPDSDPFIKEEGAWIFRGQKPEFQNDMWLFIDKRPELAFCYNGESYGTKITVDDSGTLLLARDSTSGRLLLPLIEAALDKVIRQKSTSNTDESETDASTGGQRNPTQAGKTSKELKLVDPLDLGSDCWLAEGRKPRKVMDRWLSKLAGPPPSTGRWIEIDGPETDAQESYWQWVPQDAENDPFIVEEGAWVFRGFPPKYKDECWLFVGPRPQLGFFYDGQLCGAKLFTEQDGSLILSKDSANALRALPIINAAMQKVIKQDNPDEKKDDEKVIADRKEGAWNNRSSSSGETEQETQESFEYDEESFGKKGGVWDFVLTDSKGVKWYAFVPIELIRGTIRDAKSMDQYWTYCGPARPGLRKSGVTKKWIFQDSEPVPFSSFSMLPTFIQKFLRGRTQEEFYSVSEEKTSRELKGNFKGPEASPELVLTQRTEDIRKPRDHVIGANTGKGRVRDLIISPPEAIANLRFSEVKAIAPVVLETQVQAAPVEHASEGPRKIRAPRPPGPSLSPLALAFLISELMTRSDLDGRRILSRYCEYVSASCGGLRVEAWVKRDGHWACLASSDRGEGQMGTVIDGSHEASDLSHAVGRIGEMGAMVFGGPGAELVSPQYAQAVARMAAGVFKAA